MVVKNENQNKAMHAEHAIGLFQYGSFTLACRVMAIVRRKKHQLKMTPETFIRRPTELADFLAYLITYAPEFPEEDELTNSSAFAEAFTAFDRFADATKTDEGKEAVLQCKRHLLVAYEYFEDGDEVTGCRMTQEVAELFRKARRFITISDE